MSPTRRQRIEAMLVDEPDDAFLRYSLALELDKEGEHERSLGELAASGRNTPPYVPAFFMGAQQLARLSASTRLAPCCATVSPRPARPATPMRPAR